MDKIREQLIKDLREVYYDYANMPEFERVEKYGKEKVQDSFMKVIGKYIDNVYWSRNGSPNDFYINLKKGLI